MSEVDKAPDDAVRKRARLVEIVADKSLITGGDFTLASGRQSTVFFDMKMTLLDPEGANLTADLILDMIADTPAGAIGGTVLGACPIVDAVCVKSWPARPIAAFYVRKEPKARGTRKLIEGPLADGATVVLVEDVTTSGGSVLRAVAAARAQGCTVAEVITVVDRLQGAGDRLARHDVPFRAIFTRDDFLDG